MVFSIVSFVTSESTLVDGLDSGVLPDKSLQNKEKELLGQYQPMLQKLLQEKSELQLTTIYAMQVHCYNNSFPKGTEFHTFLWCVLVFVFVSRRAVRVRACHISAHFISLKCWL